MTLDEWADLPEDDEGEMVDRYSHPLSATGGLLRDVPGCEGLALDLDDLWREVDRLAAGETPA